MPSFTQTANADSCYTYGCYDADGMFHFYPEDSNPPDDDDDWRVWYEDWISDPGGRDPDEDQGDDGGDDGDDPAQCSAFREVQLRTMRSGIPNCNGDPGLTFDVNNWLDANFWPLSIWNNWPPHISGSLTGWLSYFSDELSELARVLGNNNGDISAARNHFGEELFMNCYDRYSTDEWQTHHAVWLDHPASRDCYRAANWLMLGYNPDDSPIALGIDFVFNTNFSTPWGERFRENVQQHFECHAVYRAWDEENCGGNL
ncbi:MAG: hypothetical protein L3J83_06970 [Proteobacteria bacterium]|nr:hypothetical protein [Pseudomonadota bacterium]